MKVLIILQFLELDENSDASEEEVWGLPTLWESTNCLLLLLLEIQFTDILGNGDVHNSLGDVDVQNTSGDGDVKDEHYNDRN